ncbi:aldehyde ferredoxin oxidoreductase, partial [Candidatus Bathyarchaeota archaeon]|nr:aldehyde ferredoxin oxidoreductase [Candidatus Bathyarchaeota archaeon]
EKLVRIACLVTDDYRTPGRGGGGAVWGSKNLKAIVVRGTKRPELFNPDLFKELVREQVDVYKKSPLFEALHSLGTNSIVYQFYILGHHPTYNFKNIELENVDVWRPEVLEKYIVKHYGSIDFS